MADAMVTARMPQSKKEAGNEILQKLGYSASQAINELYDCLLETQTWPLPTRKVGNVDAKSLAEALAFIDVLRKRGEDYEASRLLLALGKLHEFELWISPSQLGNLFYVMTSGGKKHLAAPVTEELTDVLKFVRVCTFGHEDAQKAVDGSFTNLEDALVYQAACAVKAEAIITRNQDDFATGSIPAKSSSEFFEWLSSAKGISYTEIAW